MFRNVARRLAWLALVQIPAGEIAALAAPLTQEEETPREQVFEVDLAAVQGLISSRSWRGAERAILKLLADHAGEPYVVPHLSGLREDLQRACFWKDVEEPTANSLVSGELRHWDYRTGRIRVRYDEKNLADFERQGSVYVHPMHFDGPWSIEVEGHPAELAAMSFVVLTGDSRGYVARFGDRVAGAPKFLYHVVTRYGLDVPLAQEKPRERKQDEDDVEAKLEIGKRSIRGMLSGKKAFEVDKEDEGFGTLLLVRDGEDVPPRLTSIEIEGNIDRGWIGGLIDRAVAGQRAKFDAQWQDPPELSAWKLENAEPADDLTLEQLFGRIQFHFELEPGQRKLFDEVAQLFGKDRRQARAIVEQLDSLPESALPPKAKAYVRFQCALEMELPARALYLLEELPVASDQEVDGGLLKALLLRQAGRLDDGRALLEELAKKHLDCTLAHAQLAEVLLLAGRAQEAHAAILRGRRAVPGSPRLSDLEARIVKAIKGPPWEHVREVEGRHFVVRYEGQPKDAREARDVLDDAWERCVEFFGPLPDPQAVGLSVAYLFPGEGSYLAYVNGVADKSPENSLGIYSPMLKHVAAWDQPNSKVLFETLRHECAHRYLDLLIGYRIPRWLNEGLAQVFAASWDSDGEYRQGRVDEDYVSYFMEPRKLLPVEPFMRIDEQDFLADVVAGYAQAWALVHFLRTQRAGAAVLERLFQSLARGGDPQLAIDAGLEGVDIAVLQERFMGWLNGEAARARR